MKKYVRTAITNNSSVKALPKYNDIEDVLIKLGFSDYEVAGEVGPIAGHICLAVVNGSDILEYNNWAEPFHLYKGLAKNVDKYIYAMQSEDFDAALEEQDFYDEFQSIQRSADSFGGDGGVGEDLFYGIESILCEQ